MHLDDGLISTSSLEITNTTLNATVRCLGTNSVGTARSPCLFHVRIIGK